MFPRPVRWVHEDTGGSVPSVLADCIDNHHAECWMLNFHSLVVSTHTLYKLPKNVNDQTLACQRPSWWRWQGWCLTRQMSGERKLKVSLSSGWWYMLGSPTRELPFWGHLQAVSIRESYPSVRLLRAWGENKMNVCWKRMFKSTHNFVPSTIINNHHFWKRLDLCFWRRQTEEPYCSPHHPTPQRWGWVEIKSLISELIFAHFKPEYSLHSL